MHAYIFSRVSNATHLNKDINHLYVFSRVSNATRLNKDINHSYVCLLYAWTDRYLLFSRMSVAATDMEYPRV